MREQLSDVTRAETYERRAEKLQRELMQNVGPIPEPMPEPAPAETSSQ